MSRGELKPCPFCGGEAFVNDDPTGNGGKPHMSGNVGLGRLWSVECDECGADAGFWQDRDVAIAAWNSRYHSEFEETVIKAWKEIKEYKERTCEMRADGAHCMNGVEFYECRSCGEYACIPTAMGKSEPPNYCPNCGAKVVSE